jgi:NAD(P)-dependent dehydrogenase (short-subunit alcohol dehydrogenase family)
MGECDGRIALITGASRGIGRALAQRFAAEGACVVLSASRLGAHGDLPGTLEQTVAEVTTAGGKADAVVADITDAGARADLVERASEAFGPIDILVNNAGGGPMVMPSESTSAQRALLHELNLNGPIDLALQALPSMRKRGEGWILNISSATAFQPTLPYRSTREAALVIGPYGAAKAALNRYTEALAAEVASEGVFVNAMAPVSIVNTPGAAHVKHIAKANPDWVEPLEMMAEAAIELCTGRHVGRVVYSRDIVYEVGRPVRSLDGSTVLGDARLLAEM